MGFDSFFDDIDASKKMDTVDNGRQITEKELSKIKLNFERYSSPTKMRTPGSENPRLALAKIALKSAGVVGTAALIALSRGGGDNSNAYSQDGVHVEPTSTSQSKIESGSVGVRVEPGTIAPQDKEGKAKLKNAQVEEALKIVTPALKENAAESTPFIIDAFNKYGIATDENIAFAMAVSGVEARYDISKKEHEGEDQARELNYRGGEKYHGRGLIQLTHIDNYEKYGKLLGLDLKNNPDLALVPENSAAIMALWFREEKIPELIAQGKIVEARRKIAGDADTVYNRQIEKLIEIEYPRFLKALRTASYSQSITNRLDYLATQSPKR